MHAGTYKIAGMPVEIRSIYDEVHSLCKDYQTDEPAKISIEITQADIDFEHKHADASRENRGYTHSIYHDSYLETLAFYRKFCEAMLSHDTLLFHGSVITVDGQAYCFSAASGTGKSTHTRLWREKFGSRAVMINDDKPLIRVTTEGATVFGTPYDGKHHISTNTSAPLKAICFLQRGAENHIERMPESDAFVKLLQQTHRPCEPTQMQQLLSLLNLLSKTVKIYKLECNMNPDAADVAFAGMQEDAYETEI